MINQNYRLNKIERTKLCLIFQISNSKIYHIKNIKKMKINISVLTL